MNDYNLSVHNFSCDISDIDECAIDYGGCSHNCTNMIGSYICSCPVNLTLNNDDMNCVGRSSHTHTHTHKI